MPDAGDQIVDTVKQMNPVNAVSEGVQNAGQAIKAKATSAVDTARNFFGTTDEPAVLMQPPSAQAKFIGQHEAADNEALLRDYYQKHPEFAAADPLRAKRLGVAVPTQQPQQQGAMGEHPEQLAPGQQPKSKAQLEQEQQKVEGRGGSEAEPSMVDPALAAMDIAGGPAAIAGNVAAQIGAGYAQKAAGRVTANPILQTAAGIVGGAVAGGAVGGYSFAETPEQLALKEANIRDGANPAIYTQPRVVTPETMYTTGTEAPGKNVTPMSGKEVLSDKLPTAEEFQRMQGDERVTAEAKQSAAEMEPAIKDAETGKAYDSGRNHGEVYDQLPAEVQDKDKLESGFLDGGKFITREEALSRVAKMQEATAGAGEGAPVAGEGGKPAAQEAAPAPTEAAPESVGAAALQPKRDMEQDLTVAHTMPDMIARAKETPLTRDEFMKFEVNNEPDADHITLKAPVTTHDAIRMSFYTEQAVGDLQSAAKLATDAGGNDAALTAAFEKNLAHVRDEVLPRWLGMRHQVGMALRALGKPVSNFRDVVLNTRDLLGQTDESQPGQLMRALANLNAKQQTKLLRQAGQQGFWQNITTLMRAAKLSPGTAIKKTASDLMMLAYTPVEQGVATLVNQVPGLGDQSMTVNQWLATMHGYATSIAQSRELAAASERADIPLFDQQVAFASAAHKVPGSVGTSWEGTPWGYAWDLVANLVHEQGGRRLIYPDQFAKNMHYSASIARQAMEAAEKEGTPSFASAAYMHLRENPTPDMQQAAYDDARFRTFSNSLENLAPLGKLLSTTPGGKALFPFVTTPINLKSFMLQNTPLAPLSRAWWRSFSAGGAERSSAIARMMIGTAISWKLGEYWLQGKIHGDLSENPEVRKLQIQEGHQPNSISPNGPDGPHMEMGNVAEPWGGLIGSVAKFMEVTHSLPVDPTDPDHSVLMQQAQNIGSALVLSLTNFAHDSSYFRTLGDIMDVIGTKQSTIEDRFKALAKMGADIVTPAAIEDIAHWWDPVKREVHGMIDELKNNTPGLSKSLPPQLDMFGRPVTYSRGSSFLNMGLSATSKMTSIDSDPVSDELIRLNHPMPPVPKALGGPVRGPMAQDSPKYGTPLTPTERAAFTKLRGNIVTNEEGQNLHAALDYRMNQPDWKQANDIERRKILDQIYTQYQGMAKEWMMEHAPGLQQRVEHRQQQRAQMMGAQ